MKTLIGIFLIMIMSSLLRARDCTEVLFCPNPAKDSATIVSCKTDQVFRIYTLHGKLVYTGKTDGSGIARWSIEGVSGGIYVGEIGGLKFKIAIVR